MAMYTQSSPWSITKFNSNSGYLDFYRHRSIPAQGDDILYEIQSQYTYRPDLLAYDLYGNAKLWWVFAVRNMDTIKDPVFDFKPGVQIYLPQQKLLNSILGL